MIIGKNQKKIIDGPSEIIRGLEDNVFMYKVNKEDMSKDINNFTKALKTFWETSSEEREQKCEEARKALDNFRPETIKLKWDEVLNYCATMKSNIKVTNDELRNDIQSYGYFEKVQEMMTKFFIHEYCKENENNENNDFGVDLNEIAIDI